MKKSVLTRVLCILLLLSLVAVFAACEETEETSGASSTSSGTSSETSEAPLFSNLPETTFGGADFVILVNGDCYDQYASAEVLPQESSDTGLSTAVKARNDLIEERFDVVLKEQRTETTADMINFLRNNAAAGLSEYDMVMPFMSEAATLATEGMFLDLAKLENIHLDEDYYDRDAVEGLSVAEKNYFVTGDLSLLSFACTHAIIFNEDMIEDNSLEDPYELVRTNKWTIDKLQEMARVATQDNDGTPGMSYNDTYGFLVNGNFASSMFIGCGQRFTTKDSNDEPVLAIKESSAASVIDKITTLINDQSATGQIVEGSSFYDTAVAAGKNVWVTATESVASKRAMFRAIALIDLFDMGQYDCKFGVLPTPMFDETQDRYYNRVSTLYASCVAIPFNVKDQLMSSVITDALMQASTGTIKNAYFEVILKGRKIATSSSDDSLEMLDIIFNTRVYDLASIYNWGGTSEYDANSITGFLNSVAFDSTKEFASTWEGISNMVKSDMDKTLESYRALDD